MYKCDKLGNKILINNKIITRRKLAKE